MQRQEPSESSPAPVTPRPDWLLRVSVAGQRVELWHAGTRVAEYPVSTSKFGLGFVPGSFRTPTGRFIVAEKIGANLPAGAILRGRRFTGEIFPVGEPGAKSEEDLVLTRILRLHGLDEPNRNTWERYIYFHGTNQEEQIGQPASHGCIRLRNADMVELFERVPCGAMVEILPPDAAGSSVPGQQGKSEDGTSGIG